MSSTILRYTDPTGHNPDEYGESDRPEDYADGDGAYDQVDRSDAGRDSWVTTTHPRGPSKGAGRQFGLVRTERRIAAWAALVILKNPGES